MKPEIKMVAVDVDGTFVRSDYTYDIPRFKRIRGSIYCVGEGFFFTGRDLGEIGIVGMDMRFGDCAGIFFRRIDEFAPGMPHDRFDGHRPEACCDDGLSREEGD